LAYDDYRIEIEEAIKSDPKTFFDYVDLKNKYVSYPSAMHFEGRLASGPDDICNLFAKFIQRTYADDVWLPLDPGPDLVQNGALQFTVDELQRDEMFCWRWMSAKVLAPSPFYDVRVDKV
jgi:hypothetical protein